MRFQKRWNKEEIIWISCVRCYKALVEMKSNNNDDSSNNYAAVFSFYVLKTILSPILWKHRGGGYLPDGMFRLASGTKTVGIGSGGQTASLVQLAHFLEGARSKNMVPQGFSIVLFFGSGVRT